MHIYTQTQVQKRTDKCKPLRTWVETWQDRDASVGSLTTTHAPVTTHAPISGAKENEWKSTFMKKNPGSVYV